MLRKTTKNREARRMESSIRQTSQKSQQSPRADNSNNLKYWMLFGLLISLAIHGFLHVHPGDMLLLLLNQKAAAQSTTVMPSNLSIETSSFLGRGSRAAVRLRTNSLLTLSSPPPPALSSPLTPQASRASIPTQYGTSEKFAPLGLQGCRGAEEQGRKKLTSIDSSSPLPPSTSAPLLPQRRDVLTERYCIPTKLLNNAPVPDWEKITFKSFVFDSNGSIEMPKAQIPGYKSRRVWQAGQSLDRVMELGDFEKVLGLENFSLKDIESKSGTSLQNTNLSDFSVAKWQTVPELIKTIPNLANSRVIDVAPIKDLIEQKLNIGVGANQTIGELIEQNPELKDIELGEIDLSKYKLTSIPGIDNAQLKDFSNWQNATISKVPGLNQVSFNNLPITIAPLGDVVAQVDLPLREVENNRQRSISGSYQEGFNVPCSTNCAHIELSGSDGLTGAQCGSSYKCSID